MTVDRMIYVRGDSMSRRLFKHELRHVRKIDEMGVFNHYGAYLISFIINLVRYRNWNTAYKKIWLEEEAYEDEVHPLTAEEEAAYQELVLSQLK